MLASKLDQYCLECNRLITVRLGKEGRIWGNTPKTRKRAMQSSERIEGGCQRGETHYRCGENTACTSACGGGVELEWNSVHLGMVPYDTDKKSPSTCGTIQKQNRPLAVLMMRLNIWLELRLPLSRRRGALAMSFA